jgi:hypothetical protein
MKCFAVLLTAVFLVSMIVGCEGGREVGPPAEGVQSSVTSDFKAAMEKAGNKMMKKQMPKAFRGPAKKGS